MKPVRIALVGLVVGVVALTSLQVVRALADGADARRVDPSALPTDGEAWNRTTHLVVDPRSGHRPRRSHAESFDAAPLGAPAEDQRTTRSTDDHGLVRDGTLGVDVPGPRVLVLGDDLTMGRVPAAANWTTLVESGLRARGARGAPAFPTATVLNAGCDEYSLVHYALRGPELVARYEPSVVVVAISTGDDVTGLDDRSLPHSDDAGMAIGPDFPPAADPLALGPRSARVSPDHPGLARLGLAHAAYRQALPERASFLERKARQALLWLLEIAPRGRLLVVLVPPADLARPDEVAPLCSDEGRALIASGVQEEAHAELRTLCEILGMAYVDALPALRASAATDTYRTDGHLGAAGHRVLADLLTERVRGLARLR
ncbi:MAG: hypothetical protein O3B85_14110 [Planctomycetota bacterium]|nr:hypothetical protein [Planctomycetota bacterium]